MKKTARMVIAALLAAILLTACGTQVKGDSESDLVFEGAEVDYSSGLDVNSPEGLAKLSSETYQAMVNGEMTPEEGFDILAGLSPEETAALMNEQKADFMREIRNTADYFEQNGDQVTGYDYTKTYYDEDDPARASIYRIQNMKDGKKYYFRQNFILTDDGWKIRGDNVENSFAVRQGKAG